jgi:hypothetical protein
MQDEGRGVPPVETNGRDDVSSLHDHSLTAIKPPIGEMIINIPMVPSFVDPVLPASVKAPITGPPLRRQRGKGKDHHQGNCDKNSYFFHFLSSFRVCCVTWSYSTSCARKKKTMYGFDIINYFIMFVGPGYGFVENCAKKMEPKYS